MSHAAVEWAANQAVRLLMKKPEFIDAYGNSIPRLSSGEALTVAILITVAVILVSELAYRFVENPFREHSRGFARKWLT
jgi:peptidoglycan/LPS O-acetylase OafA/YrhL